MKAVQVVGDHEHREPECVLEGDDEVIECRRANRVEPGGRLVEEQDLGIEREGSGQAGAFPHAT